MRGFPTTVIIAVVLTIASAPVVGQVTVEPYDGQYISLDQTDNAVIEFAVGGEVVASSIHAASAADLGTGDANLSDLTNLEGQAFDDQQVGETTATMETPTAQLQAHDNPRGVVTVQPKDEPQYVRIELPDGAETVDNGDGRVTYRTGNGAAVGVLIAGDGEVVVEEGNVIARVAPESTLVMRTAPGGENEDFAGQNELIADGQALAEAYVIDRDPDVVTDTITYDAGATATGSRTAESAISVTVEAQASDGGVVIAGASESIVPAGGVNVTVDGEPAEPADGYDELADAIDGDNSRFVLAEQDATDVTSVAVAINEVAGSSGPIVVSNETAAAADEGNGRQNGGQDDGGDDGIVQSGFDALAAVVGLVVAALLAR